MVTASAVSTEIEALPFDFGSGASDILRYRYQCAWQSGERDNDVGFVTFDVTGALALVRDRKQHEPTFALATNTAGIVATAAKPGHTNVLASFSLSLRIGQGNVDEPLDRSHPLRILLRPRRRCDHSDVHACRILIGIDWPEQKQTVLGR